MAMTIVTINEVDEQHMIGIMNYAAKIGSVKIKVYDSGDMIYALEGSHRVEAAKRLSLPLILIPMEWEDEMETDYDGEVRTASVSEIFNYAYDNMLKHSGGVYSEVDFESVELT